MLLKGRSDIAIVAELIRHVTDGLSLLQRLRRMYPSLPIVVLTMMANVGVHASILEVGVRGLVDKSSDMGETIVALDAVARGREYVSVAFRRGLFENQQKINCDAAVSLSTREVEVLRLFAAGLMVSGISQRLSRSVRGSVRKKSWRC